MIRYVATTPYPKIITHEKSSCFDFPIHYMISNRLNFIFIPCLIPWQFLYMIQSPISLYSYYFISISDNMPHKLSVMNYIYPDDTLAKITGSKQRISYPHFLKKLWIYFKANKLNKSEKVAKA